MIKKIEHTKKTDWDNVASWYDTHLEGGDTYQAQVVAPNIFRLVAPKKGDVILDLACGQGYFSRRFAEAGAKVVGVDLSKELIARAKEKGGPITYTVAPAHATGLTKETFTSIVTILAFENIKEVDQTIGEVRRLLKRQGTFFLVLLHPSFRIPQHTDWGFDAEKQVQYRRSDRYLSELRITIDLNPHKGTKKVSSITFHRPLQWYMKLFKKHGFVIAGMEEWISHKKSQPGPRQKAEDTARKEFPMFLCLELRKG